MRERFVYLCVFTHNGALPTEVARVVESANGMALKVSGSDLAAVLAECSAEESVLLVEARPFLDSADLHDFVPALLEVPTILLYEEIEGGLVRDAMAAGANGLLHRSGIAARLGEAIRRVRDGEIYLDTPALRLVLDAGVGSRLSELEALKTRYSALSPREREIFVRLSRGLPTRAIARELGVSPKTVETHQAHLQHKLDATSAVELFHMAMRLGLEEEAGI